jgi:hypothetical protein
LGNSAGQALQQPATCIDQLRALGVELRDLGGDCGAHGKEFGEAGVDEMDALEAAIEVKEQLERNEIDQLEAERRVREIDRASGGAVSRRWKLD